MRLFDERRRAILMSNNFRGYARTVSGNPVTLADCMNDYPISISVSGNTVQDGTPTPEAPVEMYSCGDRTGNLFDVNNQTATFKGTVDKNDWITCERDNSNGSATAYINLFTQKSSKLKPDTSYVIVAEIKEISGATLNPTTLYTSSVGQFNSTTSCKTTGTHLFVRSTIADFSSASTMLRSQMAVPAGSIGKCVYRISVLPYDETITEDNFVYEPFGYKVPVNINGSQSFNIYTKEPINGNTDVADVIKLDVDSKTCTDMRNYAEIVFDGTESGWGYDEVNNRYIYKYFNPIAVNCSATSSITAYCSHFPCGTTSLSKFNQTFHIGTNVLYIRYEEFKDVSELQAWLTTQAEAGTPLTVIYQLAEPTTTDISAMQNWNSIPKLNRGTNIITAETEIEPSAIEVNYYADKTGA